MKNDFLHGLLVLELRYMYDSEQQVLAMQHHFIEKAQDKTLKKSFKNHFFQTEGQVEKLEEIADELKVNLEGKHCYGMEGIIEEAEELVRYAVPSPETDLMLISLAQKIEHYEIAAYGTMTNYAQEMDHKKVAHMLDALADEEGATDHLLTTIAEKIIKMQSHNGLQHIAM